MNSNAGMYITSSAIRFFRKVIEKERPEFNEKEVTAEFFLRFYGDEFSDNQKEKIVASIKGS